MKYLTEIIASNNFYIKEIYKCCPLFWKSELSQQNTQNWHIIEFQHIIYTCQSVISWNASP